MNESIYIYEKKPATLRHEIKHIINTGEAIVLSARLSKLFQRDKYADSHGSYRVSSLYFDTPYDKALNEKLMGLKNKEKFRLRYYNCDTGFIRLEKKAKRGSLCMKYSTAISPEQVEKLLAGDIGFLMTHEDPLMIELYSKLQGQLLAPKTIVVYDREAYAYMPGNVRITIDSDIRTGLACTDFLDTTGVRIGVTGGQSVLEVKYDNYLPDIVRMAVQVPDRRGTAYSKYAICRRYD